ncbi:type II toxin-antitoxin system VapC family toxin [Myxococcota bacterium]|nr:type II toxin-antitoxin system VapC family toxin [Myxococcota bacterium]
MKLLLDTHAFLWFVSGDPRLPLHARSLIEDMSNERFLSVASLWEMTIKVSMGKLAISASLTDLIRDHVWSNAIDLLTIEADHLDVLRSLFFFHKDPFDRLLIAQAIAERMTILSVDQCFKAYPVEVRWEAP